MKNQNQNLSYIKAKNKVDRERGFYTHFIIYILVNVVITTLKVWNDLDSWESFTNELISINVLIVWVVWVIFLILHFVSFKFVGAWEERKIEELMN